MSTPHIWGYHVNKRPVLLALLVVGVFGCQSGVAPSSEPPTSDEAPEPLGSGPAHDVAMITNVAVAGFRTSGTVYVAGHTTHDVSVQAGALTLTPHHYP